MGKKFPKPFKYFEVMSLKDPRDEIFENNDNSSSDVYDDETSYPLGI